MQIRAVLNLWSQRLHALPLVVLYITDKCNSRCISCDYWRFGRNEMSMDLIRWLADELPRFGTRIVLLSGGEPLQHPEWEGIATRFKEKGLMVAMVTSGILLSRHAESVARSIDELYVSLDGATTESYLRIRGVDGFEVLAQGIRKLAGRLPITVRTTVQRENFREIPALVRLSRSWGADHHSFLAVDVSTHAAFARQEIFNNSMSLSREDLDPFARVLEDTAREFGTEFEQGYIIESRNKLALLHGYFAALLGLQPFPPVQCNAPRFSAVIETDGSLKPCFFLPASGRLNASAISKALNTPAGINLRRQQARGEREECRRCVCPAYRGARRLMEGA